MKKMAVLASGSGSNLQALIDRVHEKEGMIAVVISNKKNAYALKRAKKQIFLRYMQTEAKWRLTKLTIPIF